MSDTALKHIDYLVNTIGPRGSTTPEEKKAHEYCKQTFEGLGYEARWAEFASPSSGWRPFALALGVMALATALFFILGRTENAQMGGLMAAVLGVLALGSFFLELTYKDNALRWLLPLAKSQNVWAVARPAGPVKRRIVVTGHVDTHRAALAMQSTRLWLLFRILTFALIVVNVVLVGLFIYGIFSPDPLLRTIALGLGVVLVIGLVFTLQPDTQPYVKGANDNATGAAAVLALAERLKREPLTNTEVTLINTGCEEVGAYGVTAWIKDHAQTLPDADYLVLDNLAGKGSSVNYLVDEAVLIPVKSDGRLLGIAEQVAKENPDLGATPFHYRGLYSELSLCRVNGQKALGLLNFDPRTKIPPNFHTSRDDFKNVDPALLDKAERFIWAIIQKIDQGG